MTEKSTQNKPLLRILNAFFYSLDGLKQALSNEPAFRQELCVFIILMGALFFLPLSAFMKILLVVVSVLVLIVELLNSAIESIVDLASPDYHQLAKQAKDMGSAAVFISILLAVILWIYAFFCCF